jgi:hypothetical protein
MRRRIIAVATGLLALISFATPGVASAHAILDSSNPAASTVVSQSPAEIRLDFNEQIEGTLLNVRLFDAYPIVNANRLFFLEDCPTGVPIRAVVREFDFECVHGGYHFHGDF